MRVLVIGKAKTGTTALVSMVRQSLEPCALVMEPWSVLDFGAASLANEGNEAIKVLWEHYRGRRRHLDALVHAEFGFPVDRVVCIARDVRDEMVSKLLYHAKIARDDGLIPAPADAVARAWVEALEGKERDPASISFRGLCGRFEELYAIDVWARLTEIDEKAEFERYIRTGIERDHLVYAYEDMVAGHTAPLADYLGVPIVADTTNVDLGQFGHTRRSARAGNWRSVFTAEDVALLRPLLAELPGDIYTDWDLEPNPVLDPAEYSGYVARVAMP